MLDPSVVICKVGAGGPQKILLSAASPDIIVDGGNAGAVASVPQGQVVTCQVDNSFAPTTSWANVAGTQAVGASTRRAFRLADRDAVPISILFS